MELEEFLQQTQAEVQAEISNRITGDTAGNPYSESVFAEVVMQHMAEVGMTFDPEVCHFEARLAGASLRLSGWAVSEDNEQLDLFVSLYEGSQTLKPIPDSETKAAAEKCLRFLAMCAEGRLTGQIDESNDVYALALNIRDIYPDLEQIRIYVLTDRQARTRNFKSREIAGKTVKLEVMDIERLHRHWSEGKPRDELVVNFEEVSGLPLPCVYVPGTSCGYDCALTVLPGEALRFIYEKFGPRLLEANVRSFLSTTAKVNKGIRDTLRDEPERFMAYNNGIVLVADDVGMGRLPDGSPGIVWVKGMQIVNGGQTTASLYFTKKKSPETDLSAVRVPAKILILRADNPVDEEDLISDISRYANSQNAVKLSDLSANKPFHVELERLASTVVCPDGVGRWFYERAAGSYNTMLAREGTTPVRLKRMREAIPPARRITKTDLAKYLNAWDQRPNIVSLGSQKNFDRFMVGLTGEDGQVAHPSPGVTGFKEMVAKAILFRRVNAIVRPLFQAFQANVAAYVVSLMSNRLGDRMDLGRIWAQQDLSANLKEQVRIWATEVNDVLHRTANGRMISEWAKKPECWEAVVSARYSPERAGIPELRPITAVIPP
jgi:hypothetical protein